MLIAGVVLSATAVAVLARCLQRAGQRQLADDVGSALDANWSEFTLAANEERTILSVLHDCPDPLQPLRDALRPPTRRRSGLSPNVDELHKQRRYREFPRHWGRFPGERNGEGAVTRRRHP